jgi:hypothetical protein
MSITASALVLTALIALYFDRAGYPLSGPAVVVVIGACFLITYSGSLIWRRIRPRRRDDVENTK